MKVVYIFLSARQGVYHLVQKIIPQLEAKKHGLEVVGLLFFDENAWILDRRQPHAEKLVQIAKDNHILLMRAEITDLKLSSTLAGTATSADQFTTQLKPTECPVIVFTNGEETGCFPDLYSAIGTNRPDHIISL